MKYESLQTKSEIKQDFVSNLLNKPSNVFTPSSKNFLAAAGLKSRANRLKIYYMQ